MKKRKNEKTKIKEEANQIEGSIQATVFAKLKVFFF